ncbi:MAG: DNA polymerase III subunit alpha [Acidimicrobiia bacterium]
MASSFTHLHQHTEFSMLDGAARIADVVAAAASDGQPALGITDHGNMYGVLDFYAECRRQGVNPVIGTEAYMAHDHRSERPTRRGRLDDSGGDTEGGKKLYYHLCLFAENDVGYRNLIKLSSLAFLEGYYYKPRLDWELLARHAGGVIATTGCLGGHVLQSLLQGDEKAALEKAGRLQEIFGRDNLFVELQDHGLPDQHRTNPQLTEIARKLRAPLLATNDSHYVHRHDAEAHDALLCVQTGCTIDDPNRFKFSSDEHYLKSAVEMRHLFAELPEACDNTLWIAERCNVEIEFGKPKLPDFPLPPGFATSADYLRHLTVEGAKQRWGATLSPTVIERIEYELSVIEGMGFASYFLIVWDLIAHARGNGIRVGPGRGSSAGCAVAYCLRITDLDPIRYDLIFERFLNPSRISMPDIDMDFDDRYRDEMIRYAAEKYGRDHVAQIVTFSTIKARAAVRDAARVLGYPYAVGDRVAKAMPPLVMGRDTPLHACLELDEKYEDGFKAASELRDMCATDPDVKRVVDVARGLEGLRRQDGIHAAAVVITAEPLTEYLPVQRKPESGQPVEDAPIVTQYEMHGVEELGLLKMDFLGLRNLSVIENALDLIERSTGARPDIDAVPLDDEATLELLKRGDSIGVFQLEGGPMRSLMRSLAPTNFDDVAALVALYRPGPMAANMHNDYADRKNGRKPVQYLHPDAEEVLGDTYGLMIYQESLMRVAQKFAGYSLAEADNLRKACFPKGTLVLTKSRGYVPIERLLSLTDRRLQTIDTETYVTRHEDVVDVWPVGVKPVYRLTTSTGYTIEATKDHPFLGEDDWVELGTLKPGDLVGVVARTSTEGGAKASVAEVELAALLLSEGYTPDIRSGPHRNAFFCNTDPELLATFTSAFVSHFGRVPRSESVGGVTRIHLRKAELLALEPILGGLGLSHDKVIARRLLNLPAAKVERFLGLYFCADGWADRSGAHFGTKSKTLALGLKRMLLRFGILSNLHRREVAGHGTHYTLSMADKGQAKAFARLVEPHLTKVKAAKVSRWLVEWKGGRSATRIGVPASFLDAELRRRQEAAGRSARDLGVDGTGSIRSKVLHRETLNGLLYSERLEDLRTGDLVWDTVTSVEYVGEVECFDFRMKDQRRPWAVVEDFLVHNCGKKIRELMAKERETFVAACEATGYGRELGGQWFDIIEPFADYAFPKAHAYGYGLVAYQTAWLKANHPVEYLAALLTSVKDNQDKSAVYLNECRTNSIKVEVPDVNRSLSDFSVALEPAEGGGATPVILFGLSAVRNVGEGLVGLVIEERERGGPFTSFHDFCDRVDFSVLNKRTIESLIKAGGFDSLGHERKGLLEVHELLIDRTLARRRKEAEGQFDLFGSMGGDTAPVEAPITIPDSAFDKMTRLTYEKEMLGLYVSDHPLMGIEHQLRRQTDCTLAELRDAPQGGDVGFRTVGGVVTGLQRKYTKKGELMAVFVLEDLEAALEVMVFPKTMLEHGSKLADDRVIAVRGRLDTRDDLPKIMAMDIVPIEVSHEAPPLKVRFPAHGLDEQRVSTLKRLLVAHPGPSPVVVVVGTQTIRLSDEFRVDESNGLRGELLSEFGAAALA